MKVELRKIEDYRKDCKRIQFYLMQDNPAILVLEQSEDLSTSVTIMGEDLLKAARAKEDDTIHIYIVGIQEDGQLFVFEPWQDILHVDKFMGFRLAGVQLPVVTPV